MSIIFQPKRIGRLEVKNRLVRSATGEKLVDKAGAVTDELLAWYKALAKGGVGTIITGHSFVERRGSSGWQMMGIDNDGLIKGLSQLAKTAHQYDAKILVQINHCGRYAPGALIGTNPLAMSVGPEDMIGQYPPHEATDNDIKGVIRAFVDAAYRAREAGFDGVQVHAAHGYLLSQSLSPYFNKRQDEWGGSVQNRTRFLLEVIRQIRAKLGTDYPVWLKMNCEDFIEDGITLDDSIQGLKELIDNKAQPDALEISGGVEFTNVIRKDILTPESEAYFLPQAEVFRKSYPDLPLILVGGIRSRETIEKVLAKGMDLVSMSRPFIRDPNFPLRLEKGEKDSTCISCNLCLTRKAEPSKCRAKEETIIKLKGRL